LSGATVTQPPRLCHSRAGDQLDALDLAARRKTDAPQLVILNKRPLLPRVKDLRPGAFSRPIQKPSL